MKRASFVVLMAYLASLIVVMEITPALAKHFEIQPPTKYTDNTAIGSDVLSHMKYTIRSKEANAVNASPDSTGQYLVGVTAEGSPNWPSNNNLEAIIPPGTTGTYTVTAGYIDSNGVWKESAFSPEVTLTIPFPEGKTTNPPGVMIIAD